MSRYIDEHRGRFGVEPICTTLDVSASAYYQRASAQRSARVVDDEQLLGRILELHAANYYAYGYRKMWLALRRAGHEVGRDHVKRLMRAHGVQGAKRRGKPWPTTTRDPAATRSPDLVNRDFTAQCPDALWLADFTYLRCWEGVVFFSFVIDAYSRRVVGWQFASHMRTDLVTDALRMALTRRQTGADVALIHHSDAGSQYTSYAFGQVLDDHHVLASIGSGRRRLRQRDGRELRRHVQERARRRSRLAHPDPTRAGHRRVGRLFNNDRLHESLGDLTPAEFETRSPCGTVEISLS